MTSSGIKPLRWWMALWWPQPQELLPWVKFISEYTPQVYVRNAQSIVFEVGRSRSLIDKKSLQIKLIEFSNNPKAMDGLTLPQVGESENPSEALAKAHFRTECKMHLPLESLVYFLEPFCESTEAMKPLKKLLVELKVLGLHRLGSFLEFSEREVGMRWSHWGKRLWMTAHGYLPIQEPLIEVSEVFEEIYEFPEEAFGTQLEPLYFIGKQILQKLHGRLSRKNLGARSLKVTLTGITYEQDFSGSLEFHLSLPAFHNEVSLWLNLLRERLQALAQQQKLPEILESLSLRVDETLAWHGLQKDLLDPQREHREGAVIESLTKLESRLGREKIFCAKPSESYRPERSWVRRPSSEWYKVVSRTSRRGSSAEVNVYKVYELLSQKPLRVFPEMQKILFKDKYMLFNNQWESYRLIWCEIVCGEFWKEPFERRYGVAYLNGGERLWLFKEGNEIYLQGVFI